MSATAAAQAPKLPTNARVLADIEAFLTASGMSAAAFGKAAANDANLVFMLRRGERDLKGTTIDKVGDFIAGKRRLLTRRPKGAKHGTEGESEGERRGPSGKGSGGSDAA